MKRLTALLGLALCAGLVFHISAGNAWNDRYTAGEYGSPYQGPETGPAYGGGSGRMMAPGDDRGYGMGGRDYGYERDRRSGMAETDYDQESSGPGGPPRDPRYDGTMVPGYGHGYGMMNPGYSYENRLGPGLMGPGYGRNYHAPQPGGLKKPLDKSEARQEVQHYLDATRNPNLKIGNIQEKGKHFEVNIVTKDGSLADKILVNRNTGWMRPYYLDGAHP